MKIGIKKLMKLGLEKDDIKTELKLNNEQIDRYEKQGRKVEIDNLPEILEKYNTDNVITNIDRTKAEILDKIFNISNNEIPILDIKEKSELIDLLPQLLDELKRKNIEKKIDKLVEQINIITDEINELRSKAQLGKIKFVPVDTTEDEETSTQFEEVEKGKTTYHLIYDEDIKAQSTNYTFGNERCGLYVKKEMRDKIDKGDILIIYNKETMLEYKYEVDDLRKHYLLCKLMQD